MIDRFEAAILKQAQDAADIARSAGFGNLDVQNAGSKMHANACNDLRAVSDYDRWAILQQFHTMARAGIYVTWLSGAGCLHAGLGADLRMPARLGIASSL